MRGVQVSPHANTYPQLQLRLSSLQLRPPLINNRSDHQQHSCRESSSKQQDDLPTVTPCSAPVLSASATDRQRRGHCVQDPCSASRQAPLAEGMLNVGNHPKDVFG